MNEQTTAVATVPKQQNQVSAFDNIECFEASQRMAVMLSKSTMIPETYRNNIADCTIALEMSRRIGMNVLAVMQNLYVVHGRPAWSSQFLIACVNASGRFSPLRYLMTGTKGTDTQGCIAWAQDDAGEKLESPEVTVGMAKAEGWFQKNGSKWRTMPDLMLRYRAATLFARTYAPELTMGIHTDEEIIDIAPVVTDPVARAKPVVIAEPNISAAPESEQRKPGRPRKTPSDAGTVQSTSATPPHQAEPEPAVSPAPASEPISTVRTIKDDTISALIENGVPFDDFRGYLGTTGLFKGADAFGDYPELPATVYEAVQGNTLVKIIKLYGSAK